MISPDPVAIAFGEGQPVFSSYGLPELGLYHLDIIDAQTSLGEWWYIEPDAQGVIALTEGDVYSGLAGLSYRLTDDLEVRQVKGVAWEDGEYEGVDVNVLRGTRFRDLLLHSIEWIALEHGAMRARIRHPSKDRNYTHPYRVGREQRAAVQRRWVDAYGRLARRNGYAHEDGPSSDWVKDLAGNGVHLPLRCR